jgi:hypothetical protein
MHSALFGIRADAVQMQVASEARSNVTVTDRVC